MMKKYRTILPVFPGIFNIPKLGAQQTPTIHRKYIIEI